MSPWPAQPETGALLLLLEPHQAMIEEVLNLLVVPARPLRISRFELHAVVVRVWLTVVGRRVLPLERFLPADAPAGRWQLSAEVTLSQDPIGRIRSRRMADGRIEMGFIGADGDRITPEIAYVSADAPTGVWFYSSEITVPAASVMGGSS